MKTSGCSLRWQAEAIEDGRLSASEVASFERHAATCPSCSGMVRSLAALRALGQRLPVPPDTELEHRRARQQVLDRAHTMVAAPRRAFRRWFAWAGLPALLAVAGLLVWFRAGTISPSEAAADVPDYRLTASEGARFHILERTTTVRVSIELGRFEVQVTNLHPPQRFILEMPDGQVEVEGTRFVLEVAEGGTSDIQVDEGRVALRLRDHATRLLVPGQRWSAPAARSSSATPDPAAAQQGGTNVPAIATPAPEVVGDAPEGRASKRPRALASPASSGDRSGSSRQAGTISAGATFSDAMSAFSTGDYGRAEQAFTRFERDHPTDSRAEDSAFLRAVSRWRRGDQAGARTMAEEYIRRYPDGLRRREAERLAGH